MLWRSLLVVVFALAGCGSGEESPATAAPETSGPTLDEGLVLAISPFEVSPEGKVLPRPQDARLEFLRLRDGEWEVTILDDPDSNVFHKAMVYDGGILTLGGSAAVLKLRRPGAEPEVLWQVDFGGKFSRMRDAEVGDLYGDGTQAIAVATHDQGVVATVRPTADGWQVERLDEEKDTFVHEIEIGDLDDDGVLEVYATPSEPNRLDGTPQPGKVTRYVPAAGEGRTVAVDLGDRHAKEILVDDVDGDGVDELYVSVEGDGSTPVEIRRYDADSDPAGGGSVIARLDGEKLLRFLTVGDVNGDGRKEMVAAAFKGGLWLLQPRENPRTFWRIQSIDRQSGGFEHAAILTDLDGDGSDELYVASDDHAEVRRYVWSPTGAGAADQPPQAGVFSREIIYEREVNGQKVKGSAFTWNIMPVPVELIPES